MQIYFASEEYGLDSVVTCGGYFLMADVFVKLDKMAVAHSLYSEVKQNLWTVFLTLNRTFYLYLLLDLSRVVYVGGDAHLALLSDQNGPDPRSEGPGPRRVVRTLLRYVLSP